MMVTITDLHYTMEPITVPVQEVGERLQAWFPGAPVEVRQAVCGFASALRVGDYAARELATYLGIDFRESV